jgi:glycerol-3-phosphate acyltransferase PlsX
LSSITIAIDAMGGDYGPDVTVPGALAALRQFSDVKFILVGDHDELRAVLQAHGVVESDSLVIQHASQRVEMGEAPAFALRNKKDSSMRVAINLVKQGSAHACVSAGNTGALMATARFVLKTLPGIDRPAIISALPTIRRNENVYVLDLGANVQCEADHLLQFAVMGSVVVSALKHKERPTVGLLNVGEEAIKGNDLVKQASYLLQNCAAIDYRGYVEGDDITKGVVDIVVCDGFVGNVALKAMEGSAKLIAYYLKEAFMRNYFTRLAALCIQPIMHDFKKRIDPARYNGASLVGLQGIVVKSHGGTQSLGFTQAILHAVVEAQHNIPTRIASQLHHLLHQQEGKE